MSKYRVNKPALEKAKALIQSHHYVLESDWSELQPSTQDENAQQQRHGWDGYGEWFLAIDTEASEDTKDRYHFVFGDFNRVHRSGLIAAKQCARRTTTMRSKRLPTSCFH